MKAEIEISLKEGILDPQAKTIFNALHSLGFDCVKDLKITKKMIVDLDLQDADLAQIRAESMAKDLLANPVIENYNIKILN
ncbi:phosphoribosylformylglycinamidine synthase subunit PurS [Helicobacter sp. 23-1045]